MMIASSTTRTAKSSKLISYQLSENGVEHIVKLYPLEVSIVVNKKKLEYMCVMSVVTESGKYGTFFSDPFIVVSKTKLYHEGMQVYEVNISFFFACDIGYVKKNYEFHRKS